MGWNLDNSIYLIIYTVFPTFCKAKCDIFIKNSINNRFKQRCTEGWWRGNQGQLIGNLAALPKAADRRQLTSFQLWSDTAWKGQSGVAAESCNFAMILRYSVNAASCKLVWTTSLKSMWWRLCNAWLRMISRMIYRQEQRAEDFFFFGKVFW